MNKIYFLVLVCSISCLHALAQPAIVKGRLLGGHTPLGFATIRVEGKDFFTGTSSDETGRFQLEVPAGDSLEIRVTLLGYKPLVRQLFLEEGTTTSLELELQPDLIDMEEVVVSATRYQVSRKEAPVIVKVLNERIFEGSQSMVLSESLNFQPGVRVETNCQNCGFTQVRLNGLQGGYAQILINSRPIYSALTSVYGLEQLPTSMIERVEVVRSGGSALFGSNAIAGTINIITKEPVMNTWEVQTNLSLIDGTASDQTTNVNASIVGEQLRSGVTFYGMFRNREAFDANGDGFTELTRLENNTLGAKAFFKPSDRQKITLDLNAIREYRRGGDRLDLAPHFTDITEQLDHNTFIGGLNYEWQSKDRSSNLAAYLSGQTTNRDSYYGGLGGGRNRLDSLTALNAYGNTNDLALVGGLQFSKQLTSKDVVTFGVEQQHNSVEDGIPAYNRIIDQTVNTLGAYGQYEWKPTSAFTALLGLRYDRSDVDGQFTIGSIDREVNATAQVLSPRLTVLYNLSDQLQVRGGYARGFRAPQAFNEDLHISSVGGEPQFVILSDELDKETSDAFTASLDYTFTEGFKQFNALIEGFYTTLNAPFTIVSTGSVLENGSIVEEVRNGSGARVGGINMELSYAPSGAFLVSTGGTIQHTGYLEEQVLFEPDPGNDQDPSVVVNQFTRQPNTYGYANATFTPSEAFSLDLTGVYTGRMTVPRVISKTGFLELVDTDPFLEINLKAKLHLHLSDDFMVDLSGGVQNLFNAYQDDFDTGPLRDSDYVYGPFRPRTYFLSLRIGRFH